MSTLNRKCTKEARSEKNDCLSPLVCCIVLPKRITRVVFLLTVASGSEAVDNSPSSRCCMGWEGSKVGLGIDKQIWVIDTNFLTTGIPSQHREVNAMCGELVDWRWRQNYQNDNDDALEMK